MMNVGPQMTPTGPPMVKWPATYDGTVPRQLGIATILQADPCGPDKTEWKVKFLFPGANVPGVGMLKIELTEPEFRVHA